MQSASLIRSSGDLLADRRYAWAGAALEAGDGRAAADLLAQTLDLAPRFAPAWFLLGKARLALGGEGADAAFREVVRLDPSDVLGATLELARLGAAEPAEAMAPAFVRALFDGYADRFDEQLTGELRYCGPALIRDALRRMTQRRFGRALDLGCGTGLMGEAIRSDTDHLAGCDLSPAMIAKARGKALYDRLAVADIRAYLDAQPAASADLVLAADVLVYLGDLAPVFVVARRVLCAGSLFAFTVQAHDDEGFALGHDARYAHSENYLRKAAAGSGLEPMLIEHASTRLDRGEPVPGLVVVFRKA